MAILPREVTKTDGKGVEVTLVFDLAQPSDVDEIFELIVDHYFTATPLAQVYLIHESEEARRPLSKLKELRHL